MRFRGFALLAVFLPSAVAAADCGAAAPYDCAVALVKSDRFAPAIEILDKIVAQAPQDLKALNLLGIALTGAGQIDKANARFRQVLKLDPAFYPAWKNLGVNEFTLNHPAQAKTAFEQVLARSPQDDVAHAYLAEIAFGARQCAVAIGQFEQSRARVAESPVALLHYSDCLAQSGRLQDAASAIAGLPAERQFEAGLLLGKAGAFLAAAKSFALARQVAKDPYLAAYNQTLMLIQGGDSNGAIQVASGLFARGMRRAELYNLVSEAYLKSGHIEGAYDALRAATELEPDGEDNYVDLAGICLEYENYDLGLEIVDIGLRHLPNSYRLRLDRGVLLAQKGLALDAEKDFEAAAKLSPAESLPYAALAMAWMQIGDVAHAVEELRPRVRQNEGGYMLPYILGIALIRSGAEPGTDAAAEARRAFETSIRRNPQFSRAHAELGKLLLKSGDVPGAIRQLETAVKLDEKDGAAFYQLAQAYRRKGDTERAQQMLARVTKLRDEKEGIDPGTEMKRIVREGVASAGRTVAQ
jgi:tetratricopeptide (TPR) repeat protein